MEEKGKIYFKLDKASHGQVPGASDYHARCQCNVAERKIVLLGLFCHYYNFTDLHCLVF